MLNPFHICLASLPQQLPQQMAVVMGCLAALQARSPDVLALLAGEPDEGLEFAGPALGYIILESRIVRKWFKASAYL